MRTTTVLAAAALATTAGLATASPALAQPTPCPTPVDGYSCPDSGVLPQTQEQVVLDEAAETDDTDAATTTGSGSTGSGVAGTGAATGDLPFTGGEVALLSMLGVGALAGGTVLVLAGRRRTASPA